MHAYVCVYISIDVSIVWLHVRARCIVRSEFNRIRCVSLRLFMHGCVCTCTRVYGIVLIRSAYRFCSRSSADRRLADGIRIRKRCRMPIIRDCYYRCNWHSTGNFHQMNGYAFLSLATTLTSRSAIWPSWPALESLARWSSGNVWYKNGECRSKRSLFLSTSNQKGWPCYLSFENWLDHLEVTYTIV